MSMTWSQPTAEEQLAFLQHLQRLFSEGDFTSTYKYALLLTFAELSVEHGDDSGAPLSLSLLQIAEKFAEFYWPQTAPYNQGAEAADRRVLAQNRGQQAAIVNHLMKLRTANVTTFAQARRHADWKPLLASIARVVRDMPVQFLQNVGGQSEPFLYPTQIVNNQLELRPGVAYNLRRFQEFIHQMIRAAWAQHVRDNRQNAPLIGRAADLQDFMFGASRASLVEVTRVLQPLQNSKCFFCDGSLRDSMAVDHFISWSRYPRDTALNFVLAHRTCNANKRSMLAGKRHLERWLDRNAREGETILGELSAFAGDASASNTVARWAYQQGLDADAHAWLHGRQTEPVRADYLASFPAH